MSIEAQIETKKRLDLINDFVKEIQDDVVGIILVGSTAYAPNVNVRKDSDIDIIVVYDDIKKCAADYFNEAEYLLNKSYDGYLVKRHKNLEHRIDLKSKNSYDLNLSIHNINYSALQTISYGNYETLAYYRQSQKSTMYYSKDFDGNEHPFKPECVSDRGQLGERRIDSIAFKSPQGNYVIGNDMDKLLSGAQIIYDVDGKMENIINTLWLNVTKKLIEHRRKHHQKIDPHNEDIAPLLFRYDRFSEKTKQDIKNKTIYYTIKNLELEKEQKDKLRGIEGTKNKQKPNSNNLTTKQKILMNKILTFKAKFTGKC